MAGYGRYGYGRKRRVITKGSMGRPKRMRFSAFKRRFPIRRRFRNSYSYRRFKTGYGRKRRFGTNYRVTDYETVRITQGETAHNVTTANVFNYIVTAYDVPANDVQLAPYLNMYDEMKMLKHETEFWLDEADEYTESNYQMPRYYRCYDKNSRIETTATPKEAALLMRNPRTKSGFMRPGRTLKFTIYPKYAYETVQTKSDTQGIITPANETTSQYVSSGRNPWRLCGYAVNTTINAMNCHYLALLGKFAVGQTILRSRRYITYAFRSKRQQMAQNEV